MSSYLFTTLCTCQYEADMPEGITKRTVEVPSSEERLGLIKVVSLNSSCENDGPAANGREVKESDSIQNVEATRNVSKDVGPILNNQLDGKGSLEGFIFLWEQWTSRPYFKVDCPGSIFKLVLWCIRCDN